MGIRGLFLGLGALLLVVSAQAEDVFGVGPADALMNEAIAEAQATLPMFLANSFDENGVSRAGALVKVAVEPEVADQGLEHIWVEKIRQVSLNQFEGVLINEPVYFTGAIGDVLEFKRSDISDWSFEDETGIYGQFTTRALIEIYSDDDWSDIKATLSRNPVPSNW